MLGPDVSSWQTGVDWRAVFASGRHFCFFKTDEGGTFRDPTAHANRVAARDAGFILRGLYDFARLGDPVSQANFFVDDVGAQQPGEVYVLDAELHGLTADWCVAWANQVRARLGAVRLALYCSTDYYWSDLRADPRLNAVFGFKWIAQYRLDYQLVLSSNPCPSIPGGQFWQYTDRAQVPGVGSCDESYFAGTDSDLAALVGATPVPEEETMAVRYSLPNGEVFATEGVTRRYVGNPLDNDVLNDIGIKLVDIDPTKVQAFHDGLVDAHVAAADIDVNALASTIAADINVKVDAATIAAAIAKVLGAKLSS